MEVRVRVRVEVRVRVRVEVRVRVRVRVEVGMRVSLHQEVATALAGDGLKEGARPPRRVPAAW